MMHTTRIDRISQAIGVDEKAMSAGNWLDDMHCWDDNTELLDKLFLLFTVHVLVHTLVLIYVVPWFAMDCGADEDRHNCPYKECSESLPISWFSANPIHCLRSRYLYEHNPPCDYWVQGKDHLLRVNPDLHLYYQSDQAEKEEFDIRKELSYVRHEVTSKFRHFDSDTP